MRKSYFSLIRFSFSRFRNVPRALEIHMGPITDVHLLAEILKINRWSYLRLLRTILTPEMILILEPNTETHIPG